MKFRNNKELFSNATTFPSIFCCIAEYQVSTSLFNPFRLVHTSLPQSKSFLIIILDNQAISCTATSTNSYVICSENSGLTISNNFVLKPHNLKNADLFIKSNDTQECIYC